MRSDRSEFVAAAVQTGCVLLVGLPMLALIEAAPAEWFKVFDVLGPDFRPWLMGVAAMIAIIPPMGFSALVLKALKLPQPRD